jgi:hypothetical protein
MAISVRKIPIYSVPFLSNRQIEKRIPKKSTITTCTGLILMGVGFAVSMPFPLQIEISRLYKPMK